MSASQNQILVIMAASGFIKIPTNPKKIDTYKNVTFSANR